MQVPSFNLGDGAEVVEAPDCLSEVSEFESRHSRHGALAQLVEQATLNRQVPRSSLGGPTIYTELWVLSSVVVATDF